MPVLKGISLAILALLSLAACGGGSVAPATASADPASPTASAAASKIAGGTTFTVTSASKGTVRAREQLANVQAPSDAVLTTSKLTGSFTLKPDGTFTADSKITADLTALQSDRSQRDQFIKMSTLETRSFPNAEFVPKTTNGLTLPLADGADLTFKITGAMTIHGTTKEVTLDVKAKRSGSDLTATVTNDGAPWIFADFGMTVPRVATVLSIVDKLNIQVDLVATEMK